MANKGTRLRCRNVMYVQQIKHLPKGKTPEDIIDIVANKLDSTPEKYAAIIHDKDTSDSGKHAADHLNIMMHFKNAVSVNHLAQQIGDKPEYFQVWNNGANNGFAYLIHATTGARAKHQYDVSEVKANFDYAGLIRDIGEKVARNGGKQSTGMQDRIDNMLDLLATGGTTLKKIKETIPGSVYAKHSTQFDRAQSLYLERSAEQFYKKMKENNETVKVYWLYGASGTGKTRLAESVLSKRKETYYKTSAKRDPFEFYTGEHNILLDELRPEDIPYAELLSMFDPYSRGRSFASSRYYNKKLAVSLFVVTTPYSPIDFVGHYVGLNNIDRGDQLYRRLDSVLYMDQDYMYHMVYNPEKNTYYYCEKSANTFSRKYSEEHKIFVPYTDTLFDEITTQTDSGTEHRDTKSTGTQLVMSLCTGENKEDHKHDKK